MSGGCEDVRRCRDSEITQVFRQQTQITWLIIVTTDTTHLLLNKI